MDVSPLAEICDKIRRSFDQKDQAREKGLTLSREVIRNSANAIRAVHRQEFEEALRLLEETAGVLAEIDRELRPHPGIYFAGFVQDAQKEYAEARTTFALIRRLPLPDPDELKVGHAPYLNALGEAVGELRRYALDNIRRSDIAWGEEVLSAMDDIYYAMVSFDYPAAISGNLKRTADVTRSIIEKTRGDITNAIRQQRLEQALRAEEEKPSQ